MSGDGAGLQLDWARQRTCARERWGRENPQRTAPGEALVFRQWTRVRFPPPPPPESPPRPPARPRLVRGRAVVRPSGAGASGLGQLERVGVPGAREAQPV